MDATYHAGNLAKAIHAAQGELSNPACDSVNGHFSGSRYASLAAIIDHVRPVLAKHGLALVQGIETAQAVDGMLVVETRIIHVSGESLAYRTGYRVTGNIQQFCGAVTYLRRYAICAMLNIVGDDDLDAEDVVRPKAKGVSAVRESQLPKPETRQVIPEGFQEIIPLQVERKESKTGKPYWSVVFSTLAGEQDQASTFSQTIGERLHGSMGQRVSVLISTKEKGGKVWKDLKDAI